MTEKEIKEMLKEAYALPSTESGKRFIRRYEKRSLQIFDVIKLEFRYMGAKSILLLLALCMLFMLLVKTNNTDTIWLLSSLLPFFAVIPVTLLSKSERYGMDELEASCRFSLTFIRLVRMCIIGVATLGIFLITGIAMRVLYAFSITDYIVCIITPYLVSDFGAILVTRRWHDKQNIYGILAVCIVSSLVPFVEKIIRQSGILPDAAIVAISGVLLIAVLRESILYIKESENVSWNLY